MNTVDGLRDGLVVSRLRRLRDGARPRHADGGAVAARYRALPRRPAVAGRLGRRRLPAPGAAPPARAPRRARLDSPTPAPSWSSSSSRTATSRHGTRATSASPRPTATTWTTRSSAQRASSRCCARSATPCTARACAWRTPRASATSASTRSTSTTADALTTCDRHVVFKNGAKEIAAQHGQAITFMAKYDAREGNSCHLHLSLADVKTGDNVFATDDKLFDAFLAGAIAAPARADAAAGAQHQLLQALRRRLLRADRRRLGRRQPHLRLSRRRPRTRPPLRVSPAGRRRQSLPGDRRR